MYNHPEVDRIWKCQTSPCLMVLKKTKDIVAWLEHVGNKINQWEIFRILKWRYVSTVIVVILYCGMAFISDGLILYCGDIYYTHYPHEVLYHFRP